MSLSQHCAWSWNNAVRLKFHYQLERGVHFLPVSVEEREGWGMLRGGPSVCCSLPPPRLSIRGRHNQPSKIKIQLFKCMLLQLCLTSNTTSNLLSVWPYRRVTTSAEVGSSPCSGGVRRSTSPAFYPSPLHFSYVHLFCLVPITPAFQSPINLHVPNPLFPIMSLCVCNALLKKRTKAQRFMCSWSFIQTEHWHKISKWNKTNQVCLVQTQNRKHLPTKPRCEKAA